MVPMATLEPVNAWRHQANSGSIRVNLRLLLFIGLPLISGSAAALSDRYDCEVKQFVALNDAGNLKDARSEAVIGLISKSVFGDTFSVDRLKGSIHRSAWFNTSELEKVTLISNGREGNNFRVVFVGRPPNSATTFLYIKALAKGQRKPFIILDTVLSPWVVSGTCAEGGPG